jgi:hypothetical protein
MRDRHRGTADACPPGTAGLCIDLPVAAAMPSFCRRLSNGQVELTYPMFFRPVELCDAGFQAGAREQ